MTAFKSYDFRGIYEKDFTLEDIYKLGYCLSQWFRTEKILIGRDMRISTPAIFEMLCQGINDSGADVYDMGLTTTPMVYYCTAQHGFSASVMITASHNPKEYNGLKFSRAGAEPVGYDNGLRELEFLIVNTNDFPIVFQRGKMVSYDIKKEYVEFLSRYKYDISNLHIVIDCSHGMASILAKDLFGTQPVYLYDTLNGAFPNHEANPLDLENVVDLQKKVLEEKADLGVIFDGDADRVMFVDEKGNFIPPDLIIAVLSRYFIKEKNMEGAVIQDIRTSKSVMEYIAFLGRENYIWKVGRAHAALKLREINGAFGGEFAGHYYFRDFFYSDSAMLAALIVLHIVSDMKQKNVPVSQLIASIVRYVNSGEINFRIAAKTEAMEALKNHFIKHEQPNAIMDFDGYRIEFAEWWFNIRPSNTEPYLRLLMEARTQALLDSKLEESKKILSEFC